jgi:hypothetical protein
MDSAAANQCQNLSSLWLVKSVIVETFPDHPDHLPSQDLVSLFFEVTVIGIKGRGNICLCQ